MQGQNELDLFRRLEATPGFRQWLQTAKDEAYKYLVNASEPVGIHRAQGRLQLIDDTLRLLDKAKDLR